MASILKVDTIQDQSGNNIINESADTITIGASGDTITIPSGATLTVPSGGLSGQNYPAFEAYGSADQTGVTDNVYTKVAFNNKLFDTNSMYDATTNYRFTPTIAGKYYVYSSFALYGSVDYSIFTSQIKIYKNGSEFSELRQTEQSSSNFPTKRTVHINKIVEFNGSTDYVEIFARSNVTSGTVSFELSSTEGYFGAYRIGA